MPAPIANAICGPQVPGTAVAGTNGCISNCGTDIIVGTAPSEYLNIVYFEGFNTENVWTSLSQHWICRLIPMSLWPLRLLIQI
jgi:hypothetical protein